MGVAYVDEKKTTPLVFASLRISTARTGSAHLPPLWEYLDRFRFPLHANTTAAEHSVTEHEVLWLNKVKALRTGHRPLHKNRIDRRKGVGAEGS